MSEEFKKLPSISREQRHSSSILLLVIITLVCVVFMLAVTEIDSVVRGLGKLCQCSNQLVQSSNRVL